MNKKNDGISFKDLVAIFAPRMWIVVIVALVLGLALSCYAAFIKGDEYTSQTLLMISKEDGDNSSVTQGDRVFSGDMIETYSIIINSDNFLNLVTDSLNDNQICKDNGWDITNKFIRNHLKITQKGESEIFNIAIVTDNAELSCVIAKAIADTVKDKLVTLMPPAYETVGVSVIDDARVPKQPNDKGVVKKGIIGALVGAIICMAIIFIRSLMDVVVRDKKTLEENFDLPVLGVIPRYNSSEK